MQVSMQLSYAGGFKEAADQVARSRRPGSTSCGWPRPTASTPSSLMGYLAATHRDRRRSRSGILPIYTRTPTLLAMTAAGIDALSDGRCILGLGASGPQVIEGFHGVPYDKPLGRTREIIDICRQVWRARSGVEHDGPATTSAAPRGAGHRAGQAAQAHHPPRARPRSRSTSPRSARRTSR